MCCVNELTEEYCEKNAVSECPECGARLGVDGEVLETNDCYYSPCVCDKCGYRPCDQSC